VFPTINLYEPNSYVINHVNLALSKKTLNTSIVLTKKTMSIVKILHKIGCIHKYYVLRKLCLNGKYRLSIRFSVFFYKNKPFFKGVKLISTGSRKFTITYKALKLVSKLLKSSTLILSTSMGVITHREALMFRIGGLVICSVS